MQEIVQLKQHYTEYEYPFLVKEVMIYIDKLKKQKNTSEEVSLVDIIMEFSFQNNLDVELVGDAIASDVYFKSFIEKDCELHRIFLTDQSQLNETW